MSESSPRASPSCLARLAAQAERRPPWVRQNGVPNLVALVSAVGSDGLVSDQPPDVADDAPVSSVATDKVPTTDVEVPDVTGVRAGGEPADDQPAAEAVISEPSAASPAETGTAVPPDWAVQSWVRHPRLEVVLGARIADITWDVIANLVARKAPEDQSLDFKRDMYVLDKAVAADTLPGKEKNVVDARIAKDRHELCKDVTALVVTPVSSSGVQPGSTASDFLCRRLASPGG